MGLETGTYIDDLNSSNPDSADVRAQGDDHLRLIKSVLKATFPNADHAIYLEQARADLASATTTDLGAQTTNYINITGTTTITGFGTIAAGMVKLVRFAAALTLTHNASSLILPGGANITTAAGDHLLAISLGSGNWQVAWYVKASGDPVDITPTFDSVYMNEQSAAGADVAGDGQFWVKDDTPNTPWFTDDAGTDFQLATKTDLVGQQTIWIPAGALEPRVTTAPAASNAVEIGTSLIALRSMDFATDADDHAGIGILMPKGWDESTLIVQAVWSAASGSGGVTWAVRAGAYADDDALTTALGTAVTIDDTLLATGDVQISPESGALTVAGSPGAEEWVYFEIFRDVSDANDTLAADARLHGLKIHYTTDALTDD